MKNPAATLWSVVCVCFPSSLWVARKCSLLVGVLIYHDEIITVHTLECWSSEVSVQSVSLCIEFCGDVSDGSSVSSPYGSMLQSVAGYGSVLHTV